MFESANVDDQRMMFLGCVVLIKNKFVYVNNIVNGSWSVTTLRDGKNHILKDCLKDVSPPYARLGMVNFSSGAIFVKRRPARLYRVGYSMENLKADYIPGLKYGAAKVADRFRLDSRQLYDCLKNNYPSLEEAYEKAKLLDSPVAFDKQFAIDNLGQVAFKLEIVGGYDGKKIHFNKGREFLELLIGDVNGKDFRSLKQEKG